MIRPHQPTVATRIGFLGILAATVIPLTSHAENVFQTWVNRYDPNFTQSPGANAVAIDKNGNVAVAGYTRSGTDRIYYVAKHDPLTGAVQAPWPRTYDNGVGTNEANAVTFDSAGNIIVTGESQSANGLDYFTRKYDADGNILWSVRYDADSGSDRALFIAVDSSDNVIVTGRSFIGSVSGDDIYTVKYNGVTGGVLSSFRYTGAGTRTDYPTGLAIDSAGKVIVCGVTTDATSSDFYVAKYDMSTLVATADWTRIFGTTRDDEAHAVAVDSLDNVIVTGLLRNGDNTHGFFTRKYTSAGAVAWDQTYDQLAGDFNGGARSVAVDAAGNVFVTGVAEIDNFNTTFFTAKSFAADGALDWSIRAPLFTGNLTVDVDITFPVKIAIDPAGNPIVSGSPGIVGQSNDFYIGKYSSLNEGAPIWQKLIKGAFPNEGSDEFADMAVDSFGNIIMTGNSVREAGTLFEIVTTKFGTTALATGDSIVGNGVPDDAKISALFSPATGDAGEVGARVTLAAGKKRLGAIVTVGGGKGLSVPAVQGAAAPGIADGKFKTFLDPVLAPNGRVAFVGKVSGVKGSEATGIWTNAFNPAGTLELALQQGKQVPGMAQGIVLQSISSISLRNGQLIALIKVAGKTADVTKANSTVLYGLTDIGTGVSLFRTGDTITVDMEETTIKSLSILTPPKGSTGHGRYQGDARVIARVTLADKRTAILTALTNGTVAVLTNTAKDASTMVAGATWNSFGLPAIDTDGFRYTTLGSLSIGDGDVSKANDSIIGYSFNAGAFVKVAREGDDASGIQGAKYASFLDPLVNENGRVAFVGTAKGSGVKGGNNKGLWFGLPASVGLIARTNHPDFPATDGSGADIDAKWSSFTSLALPGGVGSGPLFLAKISGKDASKKTSVGLWGVDSKGLVRKLIRNGDQFGDDTDGLTVKKFTVLQPTSGSVGATRSFSAGGSVGVLVNFSDKSTGVVNIGIP